MTRRAGSASPTGETSGPLAKRPSSVCPPVGSLEVGSREGGDDEVEAWPVWDSMPGSGWLRRQATLGIVGPISMNVLRCKRLEASPSAVWGPDVCLVSQAPQGRLARHIEDGCLAA